MEIQSFLLDSYLSSDGEDNERPSERSEVDSELLSKLYDGTSLTVLDSYLLLLQYAVRHSLNKKAFFELLQVVGAHLPTKKIISSYKLKKVFTDFFADIQGTTHYCCSRCHQLLHSISATCSNGCKADVNDFPYNSCWTSTEEKITR